MPGTILTVRKTAHDRMPESISKDKAIPAFMKMHSLAAGTSQFEFLHILHMHLQSHEKRSRERNLVDMVGGKKKKKRK